MPVHNRSKRAELVAIGNEGQRKNYGTIASRKTCGEVVVWLTYSDVDHMWWIVINSGDRPVGIGFKEARRSTCWEQFTDLATATDCHKLLSENAQLRN